MTKVGPYTRHVRAAGLALLIALAAAGCGDLTPPPTPTTTASPTGPSVLKPDPKRFGGPTNFILNPSFEGGIAPWQTATPNSILQLTNARHRAGRAAVRVTTSIAAPYGIQLANVVNLPSAGDTYELSAWVRSADRPKRVSLLLIDYLSNGAETVANHTARVGNAWTHIVATGRARSKRGVSLTALITVGRGIGAGDAFFLDGVKVVLVD